MKICIQFEDDLIIHRKKLQADPYSNYDATPKRKTRYDNQAINLA